MLTAAEEVAVLLQADAAFLCLLEPEGDALRIQPGFGFLASEEGELLPVQGSFAGYTMLSGAVQRATDVSTEPRVLRGRERRWKGCPVIAAPLQLADRALGCVVAVRRRGESAFGPGDLHRLGPVAETLSSAIETMRRYDSARASREQIDVERREVELRLWQERYETVSRARHVVVFEWDLGRNTLVWGESYPAVFGAPPELPLLPLEQWLTQVHPEDRGAAQHGLGTAAQGDAALRLELRVAHADGGWRLVRLRECDRKPGLNGVRLIGIAEDLTERESVVGERERRARSDATAQIVRGLRHEINNPLAVVLGQAQLLRREDAVREDPLLGPAIDAIYEESLRIQTLVQRLGSLEAAGLPDPILGPRGGFNLPAGADPFDQPE